MSGLGTTTFFSDSQIADVTAQLFAGFPYQPGISTNGVTCGDSSSAMLSAANLTIDVDDSGLTIEPTGAFSDWVRVTVTRTYDSGANDCYSVAVGDLLLGSITNLSGSSLDSAEILEGTANSGFEGIGLADFLGASNADAFEANPLASNEAQRTSWKVFGISQFANNMRGGALGELALTTQVPNASYPGATSGSALRIDLDEPSACGILMQHKGFDPTQFQPGDFITLSMNLFVDLNYGSVASDDLINEASNGPILAMALGTQPGNEAMNANYINFPIHPKTADVFKPGGFFGANGQGGSRMTNIVAGLHGKWTRHEVTLRVPEVGIEVSGPVGVGNVVFPNSIAAYILIGRQPASGGFPGTGLENHTQTFFLDNICISKIPGALALAHGATNVPMISAGWGFQYEDGIEGTRTWNEGLGIPSSIARGQTIFGSFSDEAPVNNPAAILNDLDLVGHSQSEGNAAAGWLEGMAFDQTGKEIDGDLAFIAEGGTITALPYPFLDSGNKAMALAPEPSKAISNFPIPNANLNTPHRGTVQVMTPYLDMRLMSEARLPGLRVGDVTYAGGSGGPENQNSIQGNVSGVFGLRWFHRTNSRTTSTNPSLAALLTNADQTNGLVATRMPTALTSEDNNNYDGTVWIDDMITGNIVSFASNRAYYDLVLNAGMGRPGWETTGNNALAATLQVQNPGAQLATVGFIRASGAAQGVLHNNLDTLGLNAYQDVYGVAGQFPNQLPGRYSTAPVFLDEVNLHAVRDIPAFYDEDLCVLP